ncbi:Uncharacterized protein ACMD2_04935 [Ananas comosus]|uniref:Uncharacterized protein n=3 Tax=Ananas comosus TaxID=4615 RepID=A0A199VSF2_ANACO|nr:Uncharacterized protein ACMD2_04935 [Ananas comosus]
MSSVNRGVRLVKCPSCLNVLPEPNIPVYKCGGCGTVLRAKVRIASGENAVRTSFSEKQVSAQPSVLDDRRAKIALENLSPDDDPNAGKKWFEREESFENSKDEIDEGIPELESLSSFDQLGLEEMRVNTWSANQQRNIETKEENLLNDMAGKSLKFYQQGHESMKISERMEDSEDSTDCEASPERDLVRKAFVEGDGDIVRDISETSQTCSTSDDSCNSCDPEDETDLPDSSFRPENQPDTDEKAAEDHLAEGAVNYTSDAHRQTGEFNEKASNEKDGSNVAGKFDLNSDEQQPSNYKAYAGRETSFDSRDFQSARNWMEQESDGSLSSLSKDTVGDENLSNHHRHSNSASKEEAHHGVLQEKILRKVDRFRNELTELFDKSREKEASAKRSLAKQKSLHPRIAYHQRLIEKPSSSCSRCKTQITCRNGRCWHHSCSRDARGHESKLKTMRTMEKRQKPTQLFRPVLGGAPFVICYNCFKLLQLPADFLVSRKRFHKLRCGSCSEILRYSYRPKTHPANPQTLSEADSDKATASGHETLNSRSMSFPRGDPISFTEEYGFSFGKSHSTEPDPPLHVSRNTSFNSRDERNGKRPSGSRLHWLMGYSSASQLLRQRSSSEHSENTETKGVHVRRPSDEICAREGRGKGICTNAMKMHGEDDSPKRSRASGVGLPLPRVLKKGIRESSVSDSRT